MNIGGIKGQPVQMILVGMHIYANNIIISQLVIVSGLKQRVFVNMLCIMLYLTSHFRGDSPSVYIVVCRK